jgi:hypothetical protein
MSGQGIKHKAVAVEIAKDVRAQIKRAIGGGTLPGSVRDYKVHSLGYVEHPYVSIQTKQTGLDYDTPEHDRVEHILREILESCCTSRGYRNHGYVGVEAPSRWELDHEDDDDFKTNREQRK